MRRRKLLLLLLAALLLQGCGTRGERFTLDVRRDRDDHIARDGTLLAWYRFELPVLCADASPTETESAVCDAFNAEMESLRGLLREEYEQMDTLAADAYGELDEGEREAFPAHALTLALTQTRRTDRLVSILAEGEAEQGGAHPLRFARAWNFDLESGRFVSWEDLSDDPAALRAAIGAQVAAQMAQRNEPWFAEAAQSARSLDGCAV